MPDETTEFGEERSYEADSDHIAELTKAARFFELSTVEKILKAHPEAVDCKDDRGWTGLHFASALGLKPLASLFLSGGADVNLEVDENHVTALMLAELGLERYESGPSTGIKRQYGRGIEPPDYTGVVKLLLAYGAVRNDWPDEGFTPLHLAVRADDISTVSNLIQEGADVNEGARNGDTALHLAARMQDSAMVEHLLVIGAEVNSRNKRGATPLHESVVGGCLVTLAALVTHGADVNAKTHDGTTPLHCSTDPKNLDKLQFLLSHGADVNATDDRGETAMDGAAFWDHKLVVEILRSDPNNHQTVLPPRADFLPKDFGM